MASLHCGRFTLDLTRPRLMGIVNLTDDSFSGDGCRGDVRVAIEQGLRLVEEGAAILDLGAESSRPGAVCIPAKLELERLLPVIDGLRGCGVPLSIDTTKVEVMRECIAAGADMINDIAALEAEGAVEALAASTVAVCLMHKQGEPASMQRDPSYRDVVEEVRGYLRRRIAQATAAGIAVERLCVDPGFGFGKTLRHNLLLLKNLDRLSTDGIPILVGISRKSMLGALTGRPVDDRLAAGLTAQILAVQRGASMVRVHDVAAMRDALAVLQAMEEI